MSEVLIQVRVTKAQRDRLAIRCVRAGESRQSFVRRAIGEALDRDGKPPQEVRQ